METNQPQATRNLQHIVVRTYWRKDRVVTHGVFGANVARVPCVGETLLSGNYEYRVSQVSFFCNPQQGAPVAHVKAERIT